MTGNDAAAVRRRQNTARRRTRAPRRPVDERVADIEARLARLRQRAEAQLVRAADAAGLFDCRFTAAELRAFLEAALARNPRPVSVLHKRRAEIERIRKRRTKQARADAARTKALLGAFMVAQFRHSPDLHAELVPDLKAHLAGHPDPGMAAANLAFMAGLLADPAWVDDARTQQARRNRSRRMILVGAWVLDRHARLPDMTMLIGSELAKFLAQDRAAAANTALLQKAIGPF